MAKKSRPRTPTAPPTAAASFPVAGVGASAGGLEAFTTLLKALPPDTGIAFVLIQHLDPTHESILRKLLAQATAMPVLEVSDGMAVEPNHVYVIPPNARMTVSQGILRLGTRTQRPGRVLPIDDFFCTLAEDLQSRAIGIVLSGLGSDGTRGLQAIRAEGGITFAQDEKSARYSGMPASAQAAECVDFVLPPEAIAAELIRMGSHPYIRTSPQPGEPPLASGGSEDAMHRIYAALRAATGVDFGLYKPATIQRRVARRMAFKQVDGLDHYLRILQHDRAELEALYEEIFIHVTGFFRDPEAMQALRRTVVARMRALRGPGQGLRVWVPGCSSGEEAYSIAMILEEAFAKQANQPRLQIFGTDISARLVERARTGIYPESAMADVPEARRTRFFVKVEGGYQIAKAVREACVFARHDLITDPPFSKLDLISCRNVLIYMGAALQKRVLETFHYALNPTGHLFLGKSEALGAHTNLFTVLDRKSKIYSRVPGVAARQAAATMPPPVEAARPQLVSAAPQRAFDLRREAERVLLDQYAPAALVVDPDLNIVHFQGNTSPYLSPAAGEASFHVLRMVRPELAVDLRAAIRQAKKDGVPVRRAGLRFKQDGATKTVDLQVAPVKGRQLEEFDLLVVFQASGAPAPSLSSAVGSDLKGRAAAEIARLERELAAAREQMRALVDDYETAKEEMLAVNEETLASSEELQSANEELETAKEELQSSNEELTTLNEELQTSNNELGQLGNDLSNLLVGVDIPVVILDAHQRIRRFTPAAEPVFSLIGTDVGRPFRDIASRLDVTDWDELISAATRQRLVVERETRDRQGRWYNLRVRPYTSRERKVEGVLMALLDIDSVKRSLDEAREARDFSEAIVETVRAPLLVLNADFHVMKATPSFYETFLVTPAETEGRSLFELGNGQWNIPRLRHLMEELLPRGNRIEGFEVEHDFPSLGHRNMALNARQVLRSSKGTKTILLAIEDITDRARVEERLRLRRLAEQDRQSLLARLANAQEDERRRISRELHDDLTQRLAGLAIDLGRMVAERPASSARLSKSLRLLQRRVVQAAEVTRHVAHELHPSELDDLGLVAAIRSYSEDFARREKIELKFVSRNVPKELKREIASCLYKVVQESLSNVSKHARSKSVAVTLSGAADQISLSVKDVGIGFRNPSPANRTGLGILNMTERVELLHGSLQISSRPGQGTEVTAEIPLEAH